MKKLALLLSSAIASSALLSGNPFAWAETIKANVVSVMDGDTFSINQAGAKQRVILYGIDCPELDQPGGDAARRYTNQRCYRKEVVLDDRGRDKKGRTIAIVYLPDGTNLNEELVRLGLAWWSDKYAPKDTKLKQLGSAARAQKVGLWAAPNAIPPWTWRNGRKDVNAKILAPQPSAE